MKSKVILLAMILFSVLISCTADSTAETEDVYLESTEGEDTDPKDPKD